MKPRSKASNNLLASSNLLAGSLALAVAACSPGGEPPAIAVSDVWARETAPGQGAAAIYLTIVNTGAGRDRLATVDSALGEARLHTSSSADGVSRMRPLDDGLEIGPRSTVALRPGATHIMLTGLKQPLRSGGAGIGLILSFERSGRRPVAVRVVGAGSEPHGGHGMAM